MRTRSRKLGEWLWAWGGCAAVGSVMDTLITLIRCMLYIAVVFPWLFRVSFNVCRAFMAVN